MFRIRQNGLATGDAYTAMTVIVDDIRIEKTQSGLTIANCDSTEGVTLSTGLVTKAFGRYQEGNGAYILENVASEVKSYFTLTTPVDISSYTDGSLCLDVYVNENNSIYKNLIVQLGNDFSNMYQWVIPKAYLSDGWNEVCLSLADATKVGNVDLTKIDMFRIRQNGLASGDVYTAMTVIVDNIRVMTEE